MFTAKISTENILDTYHRTSDFDRHEGLNWYKTARVECETLATEYSLPVHLIVGIVAVLSPRLNWRKNILAAKAVIDGTKVPGAYPKNVEKAKTILETGEVFPTLSGPKVTAFYTNILHYNIEGPVTVDTWAYRVFLGDWNWYAKAIPDEEIFWVGQAYREAASQVGLTPQELQAIVWVYIRRVAQYSKAQLTLDL
jgi:hypothetical protein